MSPVYSSPIETPFIYMANALTSRLGGCIVTGNLLVLLCLLAGVGKHDQGTLPIQ